MMAQGSVPRALGQTVSEEAARSDLERYRRLALEWGASKAEIVPASSVTIDERVRLKCMVPRCLRAGAPGAEPLLLGDPLQM
jgi:hypothetical protein